MKVFVGEYVVTFNHAIESTYIYKSHIILALFWQSVSSGGAFIYFAFHVDLGVYVLHHNSRVLSRSFPGIYNSMSQNISELDLTQYTSSTFQRMPSSFWSLINFVPQAVKLPRSTHSVQILIYADHFPHHISSKSRGLLMLIYFSMLSSARFTYYKRIQAVLSHSCKTCYCGCQKECWHIYLRKIWKFTMTHFNSSI